MGESWNIFFVFVACGFTAKLCQYSGQKPLPRVVTAIIYIVVGATLAVIVPADVAEWVNMLIVFGFTCDLLAHLVILVSTRGREPEALDLSAYRRMGYETEAAAPRHYDRLKSDLSNQ